MALPDFYVIGAGPAGASFAYYASAKGYNVTVYDAHKPGHKPCGWAVPRQIEKLIHVPKEFILTKIKGFRVYLDGELVKEERGRLWGYIINKPLFLNYLLESIEFKKLPVKLDPASLRPLQPLNAREATIVAVGGIGSSKLGSDFINAVQQLYHVEEPVDDEVIEIWFDSNLVGYYWVFPRSSHELDIGVGGYAPFNEFIERLRLFAKKRLPNGKPLTGIKGARINIGGVNLRLFLRKEFPVIGEAAGFVYPITGEGIRPSIASAYALFNYLDKGVDPMRTISSVIAWINRQRRLLDKIKSTSPRTRATVLSSLPIDMFTSIGLGELDISTTIKLLFKLPRGVAKMLQAIMAKD